MARPWHSRAYIEGVALGAGVDLGITETHADIQTRNVRLTWRRRPKIFGGAHERLRKITLTCTDRRAPGWEDLRAEDAVAFHSTKDLGATIPAGGDNVVLRYPPVPDPTKACGFAVAAERVDTGDRVPFTLDGKTVRIEPIAESAVRVNWFPIYPCEVLEIDDGTATEIEGRQSWGLTLLVMS